VYAGAHDLMTRGMQTMLDLGVVSTTSMTGKDLGLARR
jgi:hypothetical protein